MVGRRVNCEKTSVASGTIDNCESFGLRVPVTLVQVGKASGRVISSK